MRANLGDFTVNRIGYGAMRIAGTGAFHDGEPRDRRGALAVLRRAVDLGVNHIDTALIYFSRRRSANELINSALHPYPDDLVIATKVGPRRDTSGGWIDAARPDQLRGDVEENLRQLGRDHLDLVYLRRMPDWPNLDEHVGALAELRAAGLIRHVGLSGVTAAALAAAEAIVPIVAVQNAWGVDNGRINDALVAECGTRGIAFVPFFSLAGTARESGSVATGAAIEAVAAAHGATPAQVRLAWTLHQGDHVLAIPGTGDRRHLEENVAAGGLRLTTADLAALRPSGLSGSDET